MSAARSPLTLPTTLLLAALASAGLAACGDDALTDPLRVRVSDDLAAPGDLSPDADGCVADPGAAATRYRVLEGDTLSGIALRVYGDAELWRAIAHANADRVGENGELRAGDELVIPFDGR